MKQRTHRAVAVLALLGAACAACAERTAERARPRPQGRADTKAAAVADRVLAKLGGRDVLSKVDEIAFELSAVRGGREAARVKHRWDVAKQTDDVVWRGRDGHAYRATVNLVTKRGEAWEGDEALRGDALKTALEDAFGRWTNDTYWMIAPYKIRDPGVVLTYEGKMPLGDKQADVIRLRFEGVGLTPGDTYRMYVDPASDLVVRWDFVLEGQPGEPRVFDWNGWRAHGPLWVADVRVSEDGRTTIHIEKLRVRPRRGEG